MSEGIADVDNHSTARLETLYRHWARSGAGLLFTGNIQVDPNHLERPLNIVIHDDGDFAQSNNCPAVLAPGASCAISVIFEPTNLGERDGYIVVADDSVDSPQRIAVTGIATMALVQLTPGRLNFSQIVGATTAQQTATLTNRGDGPLTIARIGATGEGWRVALTCLSYERGAVASNSGTSLLDVDRLLVLARERGVRSDPSLRDAVAKAFTSAPASTSA